MIRILALSCLAAAAFACGDGADVTPTPTPAASATADGRLAFETLVSGTSSGLALAVPTVYKVETQGRWDELWADHQAIFTPAAPPPAVDFDARVLIALFDMEEPTGGYSIEIKELFAEVGGTITVVAERTIPGEGCAVTEVLTQPFHVVLTDRVEGEPELSLTDRVVDCRQG